MNLLPARSSPMPGTFLARTIMMIMAALLCACNGLTPARPTTTLAANAQSAKLASNDFLFVLPQLIDSRTTTLQVGPDNTPYTRELLRGLKKLGYGVRRVTADQGPLFMSFSETVSIRSAASTIQGFTVYLGKLGLERDYIVESRTGQARPASPLRIIGSRKKVTLDAESGLGMAAGAAALVNRVVYVQDQRQEVSAAEQAAFKSSAGNKIYNSFFGQLPAIPIQIVDASLQRQTLQKSKLDNPVKLYNKETDSIKISICNQENAKDWAALEKLSGKRLLSVSRALQKPGISEAVIHTDVSTLAASSHLAPRANPSVIVELRR